MKPTHVPWAFVREGKLELPFRYYAGTLCSRFLVALRDEKRIHAVRCARCNKVFVPPRSRCEACFLELDEWIPLEGPGTLESFTIIHYEEPFHPLPPPYACGIIRLDGADTGLIHLLGDVDLESLKTGMRVEPVWKEDRTGDILDIAYFRPIRR